MKCMRRITSGDVCSECGAVHPQRKLPHILPPGTILKERYLIGNSLGQGGFGITYIGCDLLLDMRVAIKEYYPSGYANRNVFSSTEVTVTNPQHSEFISAGLEKFLREARVLAEFHDAEGIVDVRDFFRENNTAYIVMEYLDGITLQECIQDKLIAPELMVNLMAPVLDSLERIHAKQVIHRDISPDNIMLMRSGKLKLMDFGAARQVDFTNQKSMSVVLKTGYAPVEQYRPKGELGPWTDIYALCATMYVCITGIHPDNALERVFSDTVKWPRELGIPMTESLENVLKKGMTVAWRDRYQSIAELREALQQALKVPEAPSVISTEANPPKPVETDRVALTEVISIVLQQRNDEEDTPAEVPVTGDSNGSFARTIAVIDDNNKVKPSGDTPTPKKEAKKEAKKNGTGNKDTAAVKKPVIPKPKKDKPDKSAGNPSESSGKAGVGVLTAMPTRVKIIAASVVVVILLVVGIGVAVANRSEKETTGTSAATIAAESNLDSQIGKPELLQMGGDTRAVLTAEGKQGAITSWVIEAENINEKFKTYTATCSVTMEDNTVYSIELKYNYVNDEWVLNSSLSGVKD